LNSWFGYASRTHSPINHYAHKLNCPRPLVGGTDTTAGSAVVMIAAVNGRHIQYLFLATRQKLQLVVKLSFMLPED
jgi:hypothetical protein